MEKDNMEREQIEKEFKKIDYELRINKPKVIPYPPDVVKRRTFLLFAQVHLCNILDHKAKKDKCKERFETDMYRIVMDTYYNWDRNERR